MDAKQGKISPEELCEEHLQLIAIRIVNKSQLTLYTNMHASQGTQTLFWLHPHCYEGELCPVKLRFTLVSDLNAT